MALSLDRRTRSTADVGPLTVEQFTTATLPPLIDRHGALVVAGVEALGAPPLTVEADGSAWSLAVVDGRLVLRDGAVDGALVVTLDADQFAAWAHLQRSLAAFGIMGHLSSRGGSDRDVAVWDSLWLALHEGWPVVDDGLTFLDRDGSPLDLGRSFTRDDDPADVAHFLREAGYLHLKGWLEADDMARIADEMDAALPRYTEGDGRSWWAVLEDGSHRCVRMQQFLPHSPTTARVFGSDRWEQLRTTLQADETLVQGRPGDSVVEALVKPPGVERGISDVSFHRDCHLGGHPYDCSGVDIGVAVTGSDPTTGRLQVVAGSHRVGIPALVAMTDPYLPVVSVWTEPGDLTVHLSCTLHESTPPVTTGRKVMYAPFALAPRPGDVRDEQDSVERGRIGELLAGEDAPSSKEAWAGRSV
jgi:hypothetical protein